MLKFIHFRLYKLINLIIIILIKIKNSIIFKKREILNISLEAILET